MPEQAIQAVTVIDRLRGALEASGGEAQFEGFCAGDPQSSVERILVCHTPTVDVLRKAAADNCNLIIAREHPFFSHGTWYATGTEQALRDDAVATAKQRFIDENHLVVYRLSSSWDAAKPRSQATALAEALGWTAEPTRPAEGFRGVTCNVPPTTLLQLAETARDRLDAQTVRAVGDKATPISRVTVLPGMVDPRTFGIALQDASVGGIIAGEANEWEGAPYIKDAIDSGRALGVVYVGFAVSEGQGVTAMAHWIKETVPELQVDLVAVTAPAWISPCA